MRRGASVVLAELVVASLALGLAAALLEAGHDSTAYGTTDSHGHPLGFNDPITWELCRIMVSNVTWASLVDALGWYGVLYVLAHLIGLALLFKARSWIQARYFWSQLVLFPTVWLILLMVTLEALRGFLGGNRGSLLVLDGETFQDGPPFWWLAQPSWLLVSVFAASCSRWGLRPQPTSPTHGASPGGGPDRVAPPLRTTAAHPGSVRARAAVFANSRSRAHPTLNLTT